MTYNLYKKNTSIITITILIAAEPNSNTTGNRENIETKKKFILLLLKALKRLIS